MYTLGAAFLGLGAGFGGAGFCGDLKKKKTLIFFIHIMDFPLLGNMRQVNGKVVLTADNLAERRAGCQNKSHGGNKIMKFKLICITKTHM